MFEFSFIYKKPFIVLFVICSFFTEVVHSQNANAFAEEVWFQYYNKSVFSEKWSVSTDGGYRLKEGSFTSVSQYFIRTGLGYQANSTVRILLGAALFKTHTSWDVNAVEYRPHQQLTTKHKFGRIGFNNRIRVEQRFINLYNTDTNESVDSFNFRFRYRFLFKIPLFGTSKNSTGKKVNLIVGDEVIFSAGKKEFFDFSAQNRFLIGPSIRFNKNNSFSLIYNFTSVTKDIPDISDEFGVIWFGYKQTLHFYKK